MGRFGNRATAVIPSSSVASDWSAKSDVSDVSNKMPLVAILQRNLGDKRSVLAVLLPEMKQLWTTPWLLP